MHYSLDRMSRFLLPVPIYGFWSVDFTSRLGFQRYRVAFRSVNVAGSSLDTYREVVPEVVCLSLLSLLSSSDERILSAHMLPNSVPNCDVNRQVFGTSLVTALFGRR